MRRTRPFLVSRVSFAALFAVLSASVLIAPARATVPGLINFQGILKTETGVPVADGAHTVKFAIYSTLLGTTPAWSETQTVTTSKGLFSTLLGSVKPINWSNLLGDDWLEISCDTGPMYPRIRLASAPTAIRAGRVDSIDGASGGYIDGTVIASGYVRGQGMSTNFLGRPMIFPGVEGRGATSTSGDAPGVRAIGANDGLGLGLEVQGTAHITKDLTVDGAAATGPLSVHGVFHLNGSMDTPFNISAEGTIDAWGALNSHHDITATYDVKSRTVHADHIYAPGMLQPDFDTGLQTLTVGSNKTWNTYATLGGDVSDCFVFAQEITDANDGSERTYSEPQNFHYHLFQGLTTSYSRLVIYWNVPSPNYNIKYRVRVWKTPS